MKITSIAENNVAMKIYELYEVGSGSGTKLFLSLDGVVKYLAKIWGEDCKILTLDKEYPLSAESITLGMERNYASAFCVSRQKTGDSVFDIFDFPPTEYRLSMKDVEK